MSIGRAIGSLLGLAVIGAESARMSAQIQEKRDDGETRAAPTHASVRLDANQRMREYRRIHGAPEVQAETWSDDVFARADYGDDGEGWTSVAFEGRLKKAQI